MLDKINKNIIESKMTSCIKSFKKNIIKYNIDNLNINIIGDLLINYYGKKICLSKISRIVIENNYMFRISLFDLSIKNIVKKIIYNTGLDYNIIDDKNDILIYVSIITEDKKNKIIKLLKDNVELTKICIRNIRRYFNNKIKLLLKKKIISEDEKNKLILDLQKITNFYIDKINIIFIKKKEKILKK